MQSYSLLLAALLFFSTTISVGQSLETATNQVIEWQYGSKKTYDNPFREVSLSATVTNLSTGEEITILAFWAGNQVWKFRFSRPEAGKYRFVTRCSDPQNQQLHRQQGNITITPYEGNNPVYKHGALRVNASGSYLEHYDGTPFFWLADSWWHGMTEYLLPIRGRAFTTAKTRFTRCSIWI